MIWWRRVQDDLPTLNPSSVFRAGAGVDDKVTSSKETPSPNSQRLISKHRQNWRNNKKCAEYRRRNTSVIRSKHGKHISQRRKTNRKCIHEENVCILHSVKCLLELSFKSSRLLKNEYTECPRRKGQYSGRSHYPSFLAKKCICTCFLFRTVSEKHLFHCTVYCTDEQHAMSSHELRVEFSKCIILGKLYQLCHLNNKYRY
jgi:hypothetical protein